MATKYIENTSDSPLFVGGRMIQPGEGRDIDLRFLPPEHRDLATESAEPAELTLDQLLEAVRLKGVKAITEELPGFKQEALERLYELESLADAPRKTLLSAIDVEKLRRANAVLEADAAQKRAQALQEALERLTAAKLALDGETDVAKHPELETAVAEAQASVDALTAAQA